MGDGVPCYGALEIVRLLLLLLLLLFVVVVATVVLSPSGIAYIGEMTLRDEGEPFRHCLYQRDDPKR